MAQLRPEASVNPAASPSHFHHLRSQQTRLKSQITRRRSTGEDESRWSASAPPPEDRDEFSDDEEIDAKSGKRCWGKVAKVLKAVFPDPHAFHWMLLPYIVLLVIYFIDLGSDDYPRETKLVIFELDEDTSQRVEEELSGHFSQISQTVSTHHFWNRGYLLFAFWATANVALWLGFMFVRVILIILLTNALPEKWQILSALFTTVDPQLVYLVWSLYTFGLWNATFRQSVYSWDRTDVGGGRVLLYYSSIFRGGLLMTRGLLKVSFALWVATILLSLRRLLFRALVFRFELGFMQNINGELVTYLTRYAVLRRFNMRWSVCQLFYSSFFISPISPNARTARRIHASLNMLSISPWKAEVPKGDKTLPQFEGNPPAHGAVFQFRQYFNHQADMRENYIHGLPSQLKPNSIEKSTKSRLHNWMLIQYVLHFPIALFLQGKYIELTSKLIARTVAENMFASFMAYVKSENDQGQPEKSGDPARVASPLQKRGSQRLHFSTSVQEEGDKVASKSVLTLPSTSKSTSVHPAEIKKKELTDTARSRAQSGVSNSSGVEGAKLEWPSKGQQPDVPLLTVSEPNPESPTFKMEANQQKAPMLLELDEKELEGNSVDATPRGTPMFWPTGSGVSALQSMSEMQALPDVPPTIHDSVQPQEMAVTSSARHSRAGNTYSISDEALPDDPADMPVSSLALCNKHQVSRCTSLAQGDEDLSNLPSQPHLSSAPVLGALDYSVNSRLLANLTRADVWCGPPTSSNDPTSIDDLREKVKRQNAEREAAAQASSQDNQYFDNSFIDQFLKPEDAAEFMRLVDFGGHGKISKSMFVRALISLYKSRSSLIKSLQKQASICKTVRQMISLLLWVATAVALLLVLGVDLNTVLVTGAAALSALLVALSYLYEQFVTAVIFVALTNPYNVGDRIVVRKDRVLFVSCIRTYTTEFSDVYGSLVVISNSVLWGQQLVNESRSRNASFEFPIRVSFRTRLQQLRLLEIRIKHALAARPLEFVKDSFCIFLADVQPGRWISISIWMTTVESWTNWPKILRLRTEMSMMIHKFIMELGIWYEEPRQLVRLGILP
ncbi:hypothetical protein Esti_002492 [Eimeria stiedai]